jgi:hypothetical protein
MITQGSRVCHVALQARNSFHRSDKEAAVMDEAIKTHKETTFGWVLAIQHLIAAYRARLVRLAREQAAEAIRETQAKPRRHLAPR